ncbi:DUF6114 domain-containing protein [Parageobacillus thermoglucosidasius]|uniref:Uncharacterized protein n=1 Tax=Parageobacillus thermoglucosidasius TaxID=1426 RepID=A0AB38QYQ6_PARTM|nr:DUF6114 domain-containing protein [Parageobacillus thermoglucosidasius]UOE75818.1 hypothetical protein IMI45_16140 [Parageobacillus thermoglucosidasius]
MIKLFFETLSMIVIGFVTGSFAGGLVFGQGMSGALIGGVMAVLLLVLMTVLFHFKKWNKAKTKMKYASIGILPGALIGGSQLLGFGARGAIIFGISNAIIFSTLIDKMIESHVKKERYVLYNGHYFIIFLLGSIGTFVAINVIGIIDNLVDFGNLVTKLPFYLTSLIVVVAVLAIYVIEVLMKKRKLETWSQTVKASRNMLFALSGIVAVLLIATLLARLEMIPLNSLIRGVAGLVLPYGVGLFLPLSFGYLLAANKNRPVMGSVFSLIGGGLVLLVGISVAPMLLLPGSGLMWAGLIIGMFMVMLSIFSMVKPETHLFTGCSIIICSILSFIGAAGGLVVGGLLGLIGGTFIAAWDGVLSKTNFHDHDIPKGSKDIPSVNSNTIIG